MNPADFNIDQLRGLHLPGNAAGAIQGEMVAAMALGFSAALAVGLVRYLRGRSRASVKRSALRDLASASRLEPDARLVEQARLLRRLARTIQGDEAAVVQGAAWATRLDGLLSTDFFSRGAGRVLVDGLYSRREKFDPAVIDLELDRLVRRMRG